MKRLLTTLLLSFASIFALTSPVSADNMSGMQGMNMQQMMAQMEKMQQCLMQVDEAELRQYEARISKLEPELRALCKAEKRDEAQKIAIKFGKEIAQSNTVKVLQSCTKDMQANSFMPQLPDFDNLGDRHICDELK